MLLVLCAGIHATGSRTGVDFLRHAPEALPVAAHMGRLRQGILQEQVAFGSISRPSLRVRRSTSSEVTANVGVTE
jgi:hypothetical protein